MIRLAETTDFKTIFEIINDASIAYKGIIPEDRWHEPYMPEQELHEQIADGIMFYCYEEADEVIGVMGIQDKGEVTLIRHAYIRTKDRNKGIGGKLLQHLCQSISKPILIGTWQAAEWAIRFYLKHGFKLVSTIEKNRLLKTYWHIPQRQVETSVVLSSVPQ